MSKQLEKDESRKSLIRKEKECDNIKSKEHKTNMIIYTLIFFFLSIYLNTNAPAVEHGYVLNISFYIT